MTDLERELAGTFDRQAADSVDTAALAATVVQRGRSLRRRRRTLAGAGFVAVAAAMVVGVAAVQPSTVRSPFAVAIAPAQRESAQPGADELTPPPGGWHVPGLPAAQGVPGAAANPELVGRDPGVLHFSVGTLVSRAQSVTWSAGAGWERMIIHHLGEGTIFVDLAQAAGPLDELVRRQNIEGSSALLRPETRQARVKGIPATLFLQGTEAWSFPYLRWQPTPGVWAQVFATGNGDADRLVALAAEVSFDGAYRCVAPVRLAAMPAHAKPLGCTVAVSGGDLADCKGVPTRLVEAILTVGVGRNQAEVRVTRRLEPAGAPANTVVAGHPGRKTRDERGDQLIVVPDFDGVEVQLAGRSRYGYPELTTIAEGIEIRGDLRKPATWPIPIDE